MWAEELRKADERAAEFRNQARLYESKFRELENDLSMCRQKIDTWDKEIQRLSNLYEGGQTLPQLNVDYVSKQNKDTITKLNDQLDFVNRENHRLEGELESAKRSMSEVDGFIKDRKNMSSNLIDLEKKNSLLQAELRQMDTVIKTLKWEKTGENSDPNENASSKAASTVPYPEYVKEVSRGNELQGKVRELSDEVERLKAGLSEIGHVKSAYNSDKRAYSEALSNMKSSNTTLQDEFEQVSAKLKLVEKEKSQLIQDIEFYKERIHSMEINLETNK